MLRCLVALCLALLPPATAAAQGTAPAGSAAPGDNGPAMPPASRAEVRDLVFVSVQEAQETQAGRALAQAAARIAAGDPTLGALMRERQDIVESLSTLRGALSSVLSETGIASERRAGELEAAIAAAEARIRAIDAQLSRDFPDYKALINPAPMTRAEVQAALRPGEALILTLTGETHTYVWAISKTAAGWHRADIGREAMADQVRLLRRIMRQGGGGEGGADRAGVLLKGQDTISAAGAPFDRTLAYRLYARLLAPLEPVFGDARHLMLVVDGALTSLPFAILVTEPPRGPDAAADTLRRTDWLIRRHALTTLPSVAALRVLRRAGAGRAAPDPPHTAQPFVGFGDPLLGYRRNGAAPATGPPPEPEAAAPVTRGVYENIRAVAELSPLPNTARELRALAALLGAPETALHLGAAATEAAVKAADLSRTDVVAFATHGLLRGGLAGLDEPALVFTPPAAPSAADDALLTASEAAGLRLAARLVILSACDTAGSDGTPGAEGLSGLARAFIYAGARAILVSHWPVDDFAARALTTGMLERMNAPGAPLPRAEALRASMLALIDNPAEPRFAHPRLWAPFVVVGEGGADTD